MLRKYEAVYIFDSALEDAAINEKIEKLHSHIQQQGESAIALDVWGKRNLAYPIKGRETGYYVIAKFEATPSQLPEFERALKLDDGVLRHLIVLDEGAQMSVPPSAKNEEEDE